MMYHITPEGTVGRDKTLMEEKVKDTGPKKQKRGCDHLELVWCQWSWRRTQSRLHSSNSSLYLARPPSL